MRLCLTLILLANHSAVIRAADDAPAPARIKYSCDLGVQANSGANYITSSPKGDMFTVTIPFADTIVLFARIGTNWERTSTIIAKGAGRGTTDGPGLQIRSPGRSCFTQGGTEYLVFDVVRGVTVTFPIVDRRFSNSEVGITEFRTQGIDSPAGIATNVTGTMIFIVGTRGQIAVLQRDEKTERSEKFQDVNGAFAQRKRQQPDISKVDLGPWADEPPFILHVWPGVWEGAINMIDIQGRWYRAVIDSDSKLITKIVRAEGCETKLRPWAIASDAAGQTGAIASRRGDIHVFDVSQSENQLRNLIQVVTPPLESSRRVDAVATPRRGTVAYCCESERVVQLRIERGWSAPFEQALLTSGAAASRRLPSGVSGIPLLMRTISETECAVFDAPTGWVDVIEITGVPR